MTALPRQKLPIEKRDLLDERAFWFKKDGEAFTIDPFPRLILHYQLLEGIATCNRQGCVISVEFLYQKRKERRPESVSGRGAAT